MSSHRKKMKNLDLLSEEKKAELHKIREKEVYHLEKSGYLKWRNLYICSYFAYSISYFLVVRYYFKYPVEFYSNFRFLIGLFIPSFPLGTILMKIHINHDEYKEYIKYHQEMNRFIKLNIN